jgi:hypothetical protein
MHLVPIFSHVAAFIAIVNLSEAVVEAKNNKKSNSMV